MRTSSNVIDQQEVQSAEQLRPWLWLSQLSYVGPAIFRVLLDAFDSPDGVRSAPSDEIEQALASANGIRKSVWSRALASIKEADESSYADALQTAQVQLAACRDVGAKVFRLCDSGYPQLLARQENVAPPVLYARGNVETGTDRAIALVGTRAATPAGLEDVRSFASDAVSKGWTIVSGAASGTDRAAHEGALDHGGETIAVLGCGIDQVYPKENEDLYERLWDSGLVVTEYPPGTRPSGTRLRKRNKVTVGAADCVVMGECPASSGTLIAAQAAGEQSKPVFILPMDERNDEKTAGSFRLVAWGEARELPTLKVEGVERRLEEPVSPDPLVSYVKKRWPVIKGMHTRGQLPERVKDAWQDVFQTWIVEQSDPSGFGEQLDDLGGQMVLKQETSWRAIRGTLRSLLLDLDGVVLAVHTLLTETIRDVLAQHLREQVPEASELEELLGYHPRAILKSYMPENSEAAVKRFQDLYSSRYRKEANVVEGMAEVLKGLHQSQIDLGVVTSQPRSRAMDLLERWSLEGLFGTVITWNDVGQTKPSPSGIKKALHKLDVEREYSCYIGDGRVDFEAARRAGVSAIAACWDRQLGPGVLSGKPSLILFQPDQLCDLAHTN